MQIDKVDFCLRDRLSVLIFLVSCGSIVLSGLNLAGRVQTPAIVSLSLIIWSLFVIWITYAKTFAKDGLLQVDNKNPGYLAFVATLSEKATTSGKYTLFRDDDGNHGLLYNNVFPEFFKNQVYIEPGSFRLPEEIEKHASHLISLESKPIVNETKVRLLTDIHDLSTANFGAPIRLQKTRYFYDRVTNGLAPKRIRSRSESILGHEFMVGSDDLRQLKESDLSNQLGGATMLVTADQKLVYVEQGSESAENPSTFAPAGSGSFDWARLVAFKRARPSGIFADFARAEIERELCEEVGVDCNIRHKTFLVGYGRLLYRNGKPDMFALTVTDQLFSDLRVRFQEWKFIWWELRSKDVDSLTSDGVKSSLQRLLYDHESESRGSSGLSFSVPLIMNLKAAISFLAKEENSEIIDKFYRNQIPICNLHAASASRS